MAAASLRRIALRSEIRFSDDRAPPPQSTSASSPVRVSRNFSVRSPGAPTASAAVAATAAPSSTAPSFEDRKRVSQESGKNTAFTYTIVEAAEQKDFYEAQVLAVADVAPGVRCITVEAEISREFVPLDKAYTKPGQTVRVRLPSASDGDGEAVPVSSAPFNGQSNFDVLYKMRGDIPAGSTKQAQYAISVKGPVDLHVSQGSHPSLFNLQAGDAVEVGQFESSGMDLRPIMFLSRFPTLLVFANGPGAGIAAARALIEAEDVGSLYTPLRSDVRLYYSAAASDQLAYKEFFPTWEKLNVKVKPVVATGSGKEMVGDFATAFDEDDLEYDPQLTAAVVCGDKASNEAALAVLDSAGLPRASIIVWQYDGQ